MNLPFNLVCIIISQAMFMIINIMFYSFAPIVGKSLFTDEKYANLPIAVSLLTMVLVTIPFGIWSQNYGRKPVFISGNIITIVAGLFFYLGVQYHNVYVFISGAMCLGIGSAAMSFYRFAAMEVVPSNKQSFAISTIMLAGVFAAFVAPNIAIATRNIFTVNFSASFLSIMPLALIALCFISQVKWPKTKKIITLQKNSNINWGILKLPIIIGTLSYLVMTILMTATPLHMHNHQHSFNDTAFVIQWHMIGMFAPSLITGHLIKRFGLYWLSYCGILLLVLAILLNIFASTTVMLAVALCLLGIGWNFSFIAASQMLVKASVGQAQAKIQGVNDFIIFGFSALGSLGSSLLLVEFGWQSLNIISLISLFFLISILIFNNKGSK
jgi:MFS family permease